MKLWFGGYCKDPLDLIRSRTSQIRSFAKGELDELAFLFGPNHHGPRSKQDRRCPSTLRHGVSSQGSFRAGELTRTRAGSHDWRKSTHSQLASAPRQPPG